MNWRQLLRSLLAGLASALAGRSKRAPPDVAERVLADRVGDLMALANVTAQVDLIRSFTAPGETLRPGVPALPLDDVVARLRRRRPELARSAERAAAMYRAGEAFAVAKAATETLTREVQHRLVTAVAAGASVRQAARDIASALGPESPGLLAYAETIYRANVGRAYVDGIKEQASTPLAQLMLPAFEFITRGDDRVRRGRPSDHGEDHQALDGMIRAVDWDGWARWTPPIGYGCRCRIRVVSLAELGDLVAANGERSPELYAPVPPQAAGHQAFTGVGA